MPKELQEGYSGCEREAAIPTWRKGMSKMAVTIPINNNRAIFLFIPISKWKA
jgi:hypothetical protein